VGGGGALGPPRGGLLLRRVRRERMSGKMDARHARAVAFGDSDEAFSGRVVAVSVARAPDPHGFGNLRAVQCGMVPAGLSASQVSAAWSRYVWAFSQKQILESGVRWAYGRKRGERGFGKLRGGIEGGRRMGAHMDGLGLPSGVAAPGLGGIELLVLRVQQGTEIILM
jgi:hypothetical protein